MFRCHAVLIWLCIAAPVCASANERLSKYKPLSGPAIQKMMTGAVMIIKTPLNTNVPIRYDEHGKVSGHAGSMGFFLGATRDKGRWWVAENRLCHKWTRWFDGDTHCLRLRQRGQNIHWASDTGRTGTAVIKPKQAVKAAHPQRKPVRTALMGHTASAASVASIKPQHQSYNAVRAQKQTAVASTSADRKQIAKPKRSAKPMVKKKKVIATTHAVRAATKQKHSPATKPVKKLSHSQTQPPAARLFRVQNVHKFDVLNIRNGPSEYHQVIGHIPPRASGVQIIGTCRDWWCPVAHGSSKGWVNRFYLAADDGSR